MVRLCYIFSICILAISFQYLLAVPAPDDEHPPILKKDEKSIRYQFKRQEETLPGPGGAIVPDQPVAAAEDSKEGTTTVLTLSTDTTASIASPGTNASTASTGATNSIPSGPTTHTVTVTHIPGISNTFNKHSYDKEGLKSSTAKGETYEVPDVVEEEGGAGSDRPAATEVHTSINTVDSETLFRNNMTYILLMILVILIIIVLVVTCLLIYIMLTNFKSKSDDTVCKEVDIRCCCENNEENNENDEC